MSSTQKRTAAAPPAIFDDDYAAAPKLAATRRIMLLGRRYRRVLDEALRDVGHSQVRWEILHTIWMQQGDCTLMDVAAKIGLEGPSVVSAMEKLEKGGFVERRENGKDRRSRLIRLTDKGHEAVTTMTQVVREQRDKLWRGIAEEDLLSLLRILSQMSANLWAADPAQS